MVPLGIYKYKKVALLNAITLWEDIFNGIKIE